MFNGLTVFGFLKIMRVTLNAKKDRKIHFVQIYENFQCKFFVLALRTRAPFLMAKISTTERYVCQFEYDSEKKFGVLQFHGMCLLANIHGRVCVCVHTCE